MQNKSRSFPRKLRVIGILAFLIILLFQPGQPQVGIGNRVSETALSSAGLAPAIVYTSNNSHIYELVLKGSWQFRDLTTAALAPLPYSMYTMPMAFRRADGVSMVVYRGIDLHIHSLYLEFLKVGTKWEEIWHTADLSAITGSPDATSDPYGYVRSDGISTVLYAGVNGHIHELRLDGGWQWADLTAIAGTPAYPYYTPIGYVRGDGINAIVYFADSNNHIIELRLDKNGWIAADLTDFTSAPLPASGLAAYVRSDGISTIIYVGSDHHVYDIRLETSWISSDLTAITGAPLSGYGRPHAFVRGDGINSIVYKTDVSNDGHIFVLYLTDGWHYYELTSLPGAGLGVAPVGYVRADGVTAVVYQSISVGWRVQEFWLDTDWRWADLSALAGAPSAISAPWPYNRSVYAAYIYLPMLRR